MNRQTLDIQRRLKEKSVTLQKQALFTDDYKEGQKIRKEQDKVYKEWLFFKKLNMVKTNEKKN